MCRVVPVAAKVPMFPAINSTYGTAEEPLLYDGVTTFDDPPPLLPTLTHHPDAFLNDVDFDAPPHHQ